MHVGLGSGYSRESADLARARKSELASLLDEQSVGPRQPRQKRLFIRNQLSNQS